MQTKLRTFIDIFSGEIEKIVIPMIQRDYAQGRQTTAVNKIRERFLQSLHEGIEGNTPIVLDFVYGDVKEGILTLLDGQQRLTTLFLLHWYFAKRENIEEEKYSFLYKFSYQTRYSARDFCEFLVGMQPAFFGKLSEEIIDQNAFPYDWLKDPTVKSMLVMLDAIDEKFKGLRGVWEKLEGGIISFYFLPIEDVGLTDELYIKMNSRGKPLTPFEHFKAELVDALKKTDEKRAEEIAYKIDVSWTDILWSYRDSDCLTDEKFLRYFRFICDILCYRQGNSPQGKNLDEFDLIKEYFSKDSANVQENMDVLESFFDCWLPINLGETPQSFFKNLLSYNTEAGKMKIHISTDLLQRAFRYYESTSSGNVRSIKWEEIFLLYAIILYLQNRENISRSQLLRRLRIVRNLAIHSKDETSDVQTRDGGNRIPAMLQQIDSIILDGRILEKADAGLNFNEHQLKEEKEKLLWTEKNPALAQELFALEDHKLLDGQIGVVGLDKPEYFSRFCSLFAKFENYDLVNCAMMAEGNYAQAERGYKYQLGAQRDAAWYNLFHKSRNRGFEKTSAVLRSLLSRTDCFDKAFLQAHIQDFLAKREEEKVFDFAYYYVKYPVFRPFAYGKYQWWDFTKPYDVLVLTTKSVLSENAYQPFLEEIDKDKSGLYYPQGRLKLNGCCVFCENDKFVFKDTDTNEVIEELAIAQKEGIDCENRIEKLRNYLCARGLL